MAQIKHFHIIAGSRSGIPYSESRFNDYNESVDALTQLSVGLFGHLFRGEDKLTLEKFKEATEEGDGTAIIVGTENLCLAWWPCINCEPLVSN